eukprot:TRINITY_DN20898_c0_g1_i1.p1 TRINITY_DN20898_c0_g1~~TRINITY_DN20898_c0_g1_i1.p1  ORF type:complete len:634 (+),score=305.15 TRINITY_DN20898_c0_g1_i1:44-1903(+)
MSGEPPSEAGGPVKRAREPDSSSPAPAPGNDDDIYVGDWRGALEEKGEAAEDTEKRWGFSVDELEAALKVVGILRWTPQVFLDDEVLKTTGLWRWINRPPSMKKEQTRNIHAQLFKEVRNKRQKLMKESDKKKLAKTEMRVARDQALERLLTIDPDQQRALFIENDKGVQLQITGKAEDKQALALKAAAETATTAEQEQQRAVLITPADHAPDAESPGVLNASRKCHICKESFTELHHFYYALCRDCGKFNYGKRIQTRNLTGKAILLTGSRIKIGYQIALRLLLDGCTLYATTRFPQDAVKRFQQEPTYDEWKDRLLLHALDLRDLYSVKQYCNYMLANLEGPLFGIVHNAAQTIARPPEYFKLLIEGEAQAPQTKLIAGPWADYVAKGQSVYTPGVQKKLEHKADGPTVEEVDETMPNVDNARNIINEDGTTTTVSLQKGTGFYDMYDSMQEASDRRSKNSWTSNLNEVSAEEAAEVHAINALSPFTINSMLKPLMMRRTDDAKDEKRFIINVSAMEGQFYRFKSTTHPHTNMAKAALNMMTRTSGRDYAQDGIYMNSVDTGWITDESPYAKQQRRLANDQHCPLDEIDAAARVLDLMYIDSSEHSKFWKDYHTIPW